MTQLETPVVADVWEDLDQLLADVDYLFWFSTDLNRYKSETGKT